MDGWLKRISVLNANLPIWINGRVIHPLQFCCENFTYIDLNRLRDSEGYKFVSCDTVMCYPLYNTSWYLCLKYNGLACVNLIKYRLRGGQAFNKFTNKNLVCSQCFTSRSRRRACSQAKKKFLYYVFLPTIFRYYQFPAPSGKSVIFTNVNCCVLKLCCNCKKHRQRYLVTKFTIKSWILL